jgi:hypothetical protein
VFNSSGSSTLQLIVSISFLLPKINTGCFIKNDPRYNFAIETQMKKKKYRKRHGSKNTTNLSEHIIFIIVLLVSFSDCNGIKKLYPLIIKFPRKKGKYVASKLDLLSY